MARTAITSLAIPNTGLNITDVTYTTMATGSGNGVSFPYNNRTVIVLNNTTGGNATYTFIVNVPAELTAVGVTPANQTIVVATGKVYLVKPGDILVGADAARSVFVDCDVAGKILIRDVPAGSA